MSTSTADPQQQLTGQAPEDHADASPDGEMTEEPEAPQRPAPESVIAQLGIHGWDEIEPAVLAGVLLGEPILLISEPGAAKTYFGEVMAKALQLRYGYYDTSKANFEDVLGFPNPKAFAEGRAEFIHNEITIWDKELVMVDEISRAAKDTANKWLEILGSRMLMGRPLPMKVVIGGMNPPEHQGAHVLDEAFADRFILFIRLPEFTRMDERAREAILAGRTGLDAPTVDYWNGGSWERKSYVIEDHSFLEAAEQLRKLLRAAARHYRHLEASPFAQAVGKYCDIFARSLAQDHEKDPGVRLEPRRLKMLKRAILAVVAVRKAQCRLDLDDPLTQQELEDCAGLVAKMSMPHPYTAQRALGPEQLRTAHKQACSALRGDINELMLYQAKSHAEKILFLLTKKYSPTVQEKVCADFLADRSLEADMTAIVVAQLLMCPQIADVLPAHCMNKLAERFQAVKLQRSANVKITETDLASLPELLEQLEECDRLIEKADQKNLDRYACAWALAHSAGKIQALPELYEQAREALIRACDTLQPLAAEWGVEGADTWDPPAEQPA